MAKITVNATISAPTTIKIPLVRADHVSTSNIFRVFFEIFLSITSTTLGYVLSLSAPQAIHWVVLAIFSLATAAFLIITIVMANKAGASDTDGESTV